MKSNLAPILLVAENAQAAENIQRVFRLQSIENPVYVATNHIQALKMLRGTRRLALAPVPKLILLDVDSMVGSIGFLKELRQDPVLKASSVFVLSSQSSAQEMQEAYDLNVAGYILKPATPESLAEVIATLHAFWNLIELPN